MKRKIESDLPSPKRRKIDVYEENLKKLREKAKKEYKKIYGDTIIYERLINSECGLNYNDFVFLKDPSNGKYFACDEDIAHIIEFLWKNGISTFGSDQPFEDFGYITFWVLTKDNSSSIHRVKSILGEKVKVIEDIDEKRNLNSKEEVAKHIKLQIQKDPKKFYYLPCTKPWNREHQEAMTYFDSICFSKEAISEIERTQEYESIPGLKTLKLL